MKNFIFTPYLTPVSYTHLDVYKRQEQDGPFILAQIGRLAAMAKEKGLTVLVEPDPSVSACNAAVSYTHLDVYKRQALWSCARNTVKAWGFLL